MASGQVVAIFGYGRFGTLLANILKEEFEVLIHDPSITTSDSDTEPKFCSLTEALSADVLFYAVPISQFESVLKEHVALLSQQHAPPKLFCDVLSVKSHPKKLFTSLLRESDSAILTHPMFGPDSVSEQGLTGQRIVMEGLNTEPNLYVAWKSFFERRGLSVLEISAEEHDRLAANSQGLTHFVGRVLGEFGFQPTQIDTLGAARLKAIVDQTCNDTWQLFSDLQTMNPYTLPMRVKLGAALQKIYAKLLPKRLNKESFSLGIQGGKGSFNEEAALYNLAQQKIKPYSIHYLHTTERVLQALHEGEIDCGQFAIHNSIGGVVQESIEAMAKYHFEIVEQFSIKISHTLMTAHDASLSEIDTIMTHPQVLKQCRKNLNSKYPQLQRTSGKGELIDHAEVARHLAEGILAKNIATMGSKILAEIYNLNVIENDLQDLEDNFTSFMWVERPSA